MRMLNGNLLIKEVVQDEERLSGLFIPNDKMSTICVGEIINCKEQNEMKPQCRTVEDVTIGSQVIFNKLYAKSFKWEDADYFIVKYEDLLAVLD